MSSLVHMELTGAPSNDAEKPPKATSLASVNAIVLEATGGLMA